MSGAHSPAVAPRRESPRDWKWTPAEKAVARKAFNLALSRELEGAVREAKERAARITETSDLWELEAWLGEQRRRIDRDFDYRYSVLPHVFATLLRDSRLTEDDLLGLAPDKLEAIRHIARF
jgi:Photoprotection regulator fluorescence recovery protein